MKQTQTAMKTRSQEIKDRMEEIRNQRTGLFKNVNVDEISDEKYEFLISQDKQLGAQYVELNKELKELA